MAYIGWQQDKWIPTPTQQILKAYEEAFPGLMYTTQVFSVPPCYLKAVSLEQPLGSEKGSRTHIP